MAKSSRTSLPSPSSGIPGSNGIENKTEPLSTFQDTSKTGRMDPEKQNGSSATINGLPAIIKKVKLVDDDHLEIEFSREETDHTKGDFGYTNKKRPAHEDFRNALNRLRVHWGLLSTYLDAGKKKQISSFSDDDVKDFTVTGITVGGEDEPWVIITGYKSRKDNKACLVNTPKQAFTQSEDAPDHGFNRFLEDLQDDVNNVLKETRLYIGGKRDKKQLEIEMPES